MKRRIVAFVTVLAMVCSMFGLAAVVNAENTFDVKVRSGNKITVTATGDFGAKDWVGIYRKGETTDPDHGGSKSIVWWYLSSEALKTMQWPEDKAAADASIPGNASGNRPTDINADNTLQEGEYYAVILENDSYTPKAGYEKVEFTITDNYKFFVNFDKDPTETPFDACGGPTAQNKVFRYKNGDECRIMGWVGGTFAAGSKLVYSINGGAETEVAVTPQGADSPIVAAIKGALGLSKDPSYAVQFNFNIKDTLAAADNDNENVIRIMIRTPAGGSTLIAQFKTDKGDNPGSDLYAATVDLGVSKVLNNGYVTYSPVGDAGWDPYIMFTKAPSTGTSTTHVAIKYRADASSSGNMGFFTFNPGDTYYTVPVTADGQWHTAIVEIDGSKFGAGFAHYRVDFFDGQQAECADKSIDIAYVNFYTSEAEANAAAQKADLLEIEDSYIGASIRKTLVAYEKDGIVDKNDKRQGLRFCFEDIAKVGEQIQYGGRTVTVTGVKGLIALQDNATENELVLGSANTNVKTLDALIAWELGGQKYASSYIYNIPQANKDTVILSRVVVTATDADGIEYKIYSDVQSASVSSVYAAAPNAGLDAEANAWFAVG